MAFDFETLKGYMTGIGLEGFKVKDEGSARQRLLAGISAKDQEKQEFTAGVVLSLREEGELLEIRIVNIWDREKVFESQRYWPELMKYLLKQNYEKKMGRWCLDPSDGDIYIDWAIAIENNPKVTQEQVDRVIKSLVACISVAYSPVCRILEFGTIEKVSAADLILAILQGLPVDGKLAERLAAVKGISDINILMAIRNAVESSDLDRVDRIIKS